MGGIHRSSITMRVNRELGSLAGLQRDHKGIARTLSGTEMASWVAQLAQQYFSEHLNRFRDQSRKLSELLDQADRFAELEELIGDALGTRQARGRRLLAAMGESRGRDGVTGLRPSPTWRNERASTCCCRLIFSSCSNCKKRQSKLSAVLR